MTKEELKLKLECPVTDCAMSEVNVAPDVKTETIIEAVKAHAKELHGLDAEEKLIRGASGRNE